MIEQIPGYGPPTPVPIFQWEQEFETLLALYRLAKPARVFEVGTYHGGTLYHWAQNAAGKCHIVALDSYAVGVDNRHLYQDWLPEDVTLDVIEGDSRDPAIVDAVRRHALFDWVFIDAGHYYHEVKADWDNYGPMCAQGGVVCFHDILSPTAAHPEIEVAQLWEEITKDHMTLEIIQNPWAEWGGIGVVLL